MSDNRNDAAPRPGTGISTEILGGMMVADGGAQSLRTNFLPTSFVECMELAKLMSAGTFVPARMRGKPGDCLAVIMQASRWGMDPFAVAQKIYFVNSDGIPGYEAQLIVAVLNTSGVLKGTLHTEWVGEGDSLKCIVVGTRKDDAREKSIEQELRTITTKNSPLWKQAPRQQLAYFTQRLWGRLYAPEVMLGVYAADDLVEDGETARQLQPAAAERIAAPTRESTSSRRRAKPIEETPAPATVIDNGETVDTSTGEVVETEEEIARRLDAEAMRDGPPLDETDDETETEVVPEPETETDQATEPAPAAAAPINWDSWLAKLDKDLKKVITRSDVEAFMLSKAGKLADAPDGVKNRARGYGVARIRELEKAASDAPAADPAPETEKKPTAAQLRAAAAAEANAPIEQAPIADADLNPDDTAPAVGEQGDDVSPATTKADEIIAELGRKEMLIDLRNAKARFDPDIDALDDENAERVTRAYRALEDRLAPRRAR